MKYNFWNGLGFSILMSFLIITGYSTAKAQNLQWNCKDKKADKLLLQGQAAYDKKDYTQAFSFYDQASKAAPKCPVPYMQKGIVFLDTKKLDNAVIVFQEALKRNFDESFRLYMGICQARFEQKNYTEAIKNCDESARLNANYYWTFYYLALSHASLNDTDKALSASRRATEIDPKSVDALILKSRLLHALKKYEEAAADMLAAVKLSPNNDEALFLLAANYFFLKNYAKTVEYLTQSVKFNPDNFDSWMLLTSAYIADSMNWEKCEQAAIQAVRLNPNHGDANFQLALSQLVNGKLEASVKSFDAAIKNKNTFVASALVFKGYALIGLKRAAEAEELFQEALNVKPTSKLDYFAIAEIYFYRWELDKAREEIKKAINFAGDDEDWQEYSFISWIYSLSNQPQEAIIAANEAIQINPKNDGGYTNRCRAYNETNLPDIAIKDCQKALELNPNDGEIFFYLGRAYALKKDVAQEKSYNQKAISRMEKRLGISFSPQNAGPPAKDSTETEGSSINGRVSINSPSYSYYLYLLGNAYYLDNNFQAAIGAYQKVIELRPKFPRLRFNLAISYLSLKPADLKNADAQYNLLLLIDKNLAADLKKIISGYKKKK